MKLKDLKDILEFNCKIYVDGIRYRLKDYDINEIYDEFKDYKDYNVDSIYSDSNGYVSVEISED